MSKSTIGDPSVITRVDIDAPEPEPTDCLPAGQSPIATTRLSPGWIALTEREIISYHPDRDPALIETPRENVTGIAVRRAGASAFTRYVPGAFAGSITALGFGLLLFIVSPGDLIAVPDAPGAGELGTIVRALEWASRMLGTILLFIGLALAVVVLAAVGYWFFHGKSRSSSNADRRLQSSVRPTDTPGLER